MELNILKRNNRMALKNNEILPLITVREYHELRKQLLIDVFDNGESLTPEEFEEYKKLIATELVFMKMD